MIWCETATVAPIVQASSPPASLGSPHLTTRPSMVLDDVSIRPKRPAMPGAFSRGLSIGKHELSTGVNRQLQGLLLTDNEPSNSPPLTINSPERFGKIQDQAANCIESPNKRFTYPNTFHASSSSTSSDFQKSESGTSYSTELSTAPSTSPSPKLTPQRLPLPETKVDDCLSPETHEGNQPGIRDDPYRNPVQIPGCLPPTFVYPHSSSSIRESYHDRFREVVNLFRRNTYEDPKLRESMRFIDYTLKLCGTSPADARPSILAFCRKTDFKALNRLLTNKELKYQYCLRRSSWRPTWLGQETAASTTSDKPLFNLYFWRQGRPRSLFWGKCHAKVHDSRSDAYPEKAGKHLICGSIVEIRIKDIQFSTLGCTLQIGSEWYTTTSRHAFRHAFGPPTSAEHLAGESKPPVSITNPGTEPRKEDERIYGSDSDPSDAGAEDYLVDDIEYESLPEDDEEDDWDEEETQIALDSYWDKINSTHSKGQDEATEEAPVIFITSEDLDKSGDLDLDWALVKWEKPNGYIWVPNTYESPSLPSTILLSKVSQSQPVKETSVLVLTSRQSPQHGVLQPGTAMLGGISGRQSSIAWIVLLNEKRSLTYGDSGALVVDALTNDIYGHVIGSNPLGEIYISPFVSVLQQIRQKFPGKALSLPGPPEMNANASATTDDIIELYHSLPDPPKGKGLPRLGESTSSDSSCLPQIYPQSNAYSSPASQSPALWRRRPRTKTEEANYQCTTDGCGKVFSRSYNFKSHLETHDNTREYPYPCKEPNCTKRFVRKTDLQRHHQSVHLRERNYKCDFCGRMFARKDTLRRHMEDGCSKRFEIGMLDAAGNRNSLGISHRWGESIQGNPFKGDQRLDGIHEEEIMRTYATDVQAQPMEVDEKEEVKPRGELLHDGVVSYGQDYQARKIPDDSLQVHMDLPRDVRTRHDPYWGRRPNDHQLFPRARDPETMKPEDEDKFAAAMRYQEEVDSSIPLTAEALLRVRNWGVSESSRRSTTSYATSRSSASVRTGRTSQSHDTDITAPSEYGESDAGTLRSRRSSIDDDVRISVAQRLQRAPRESVGDSLQRLRAEYNRSPPDGMFSRHDKSRPKNDRNLHLMKLDDAEREL